MNSFYLPIINTKDLSVTFQGNPNDIKEFIDNIPIANGRSLIDLQNGQYKIIMSFLDANDFKKYIVYCFNISKFLNNKIEKFYSSLLLSSLIPQKFLIFLMDNKIGLSINDPSCLKFQSITTNLKLQKDFYSKCFMYLL